jgi:predicted nucleic acid-binding protein
MRNRLFLDTNIILDFLDKKRALHPQAKELFLKIIKEDYFIVISEDMLSTIYYIHKNKSNALDFFETIIDEWEIVPYEKDVITEAIKICKKTGQDLEDTLQCLSAKKHQCTYLITSDKGFVNCGIEVLSYGEFL